MAQLLEESYSFTHALQRANERRLQDHSRQVFQCEAETHLMHVLDLLPVLRNCRLISPAQENIINTSAYYLQASLSAWIESDRKRMLRHVEVVTNALIPNTQTAHGKNGLCLERELSILTNAKHASFDDSCINDWMRTCCYIAEEPFACNQFFLMNYNEAAKRFTFSDSDWKRLFGIVCSDSLNTPHPVYRDRFKYYYTAASISDAIDHYYYKRDS